MKEFKRFRDGKDAPLLSQSRVDQCARSSDSPEVQKRGWSCTRGNGHDGPHAAGNAHDDLIYATWENAE